ncbi:MAG TPA: hypothetical protein VN442_06455 [Bryobacteraceae bacterium]|nr:hypothetical protein [Bryobacteraceae bacterium]
MNHAAHHTVGFSTPPELARAMGRWQTRGLLVGIVALLISGAGAIFWPDRFFQAYLASYMIYLGLSLGCLALLMLQYLTGGAWGLVVRRLCEAAARTLPLLALLFVPIAIGIPWLYHWSHPEAVAGDAILRHKSLYLNVPFFLVRAAVYFAGWFTLAWLLERSGRELEQTGSPRAQRRLGVISSIGLIFYVFSITFMAVDWVMSVDAHWFSTMFGLLFVAGQTLSAFAFLIAAVVLLQRWRPFSEVLTGRHVHDLGKLLLALVMVWAYFAFSQFLIIWAGNLPEEIPWYLERLRGGWQYVGLALFLLQFALPFALLLSRDLKRNFRAIAAVAAGVLVMRFVDLFWLVAPSFHHGHFTLGFMDLALPVGLGGVWFAFFARQVARYPLLPSSDPHLEEALEHGRE